MRDITWIDPDPRMSGMVVPNHMAYVSGQVTLDVGGTTVTLQRKNKLNSRSLQRSDRSYV